MNHTTSKWEINSALMVFSIIIITGNGTLLICEITFNDVFINYKNPRIYSMLLALLLFLSQIHAIVSLSELFLKRKEQVNLLNSFEHIDFLLKQNLNMSVDYAKLKINCHRIIVVWLCEIFGLLIADIIVAVQTKSKYSLRFILIIIPSYILCKLSYAYILILVLLIHENTDVLNKYLKSVTKRNGYYICETHLNRKDFTRIGNGHLSLESLMFLKNIYCKIWEASTLIQNLIFWAFPIGFLNDFFVLIFNSYGFCVSVLAPTMPTTNYTYVLLSILVVSNLGNMFFIAFNCSKASKTVSFADFFAISN